MLPVTQTPRRPVIIHWGISSFFGWGIYGLNLALNWSTDPQLEPVTSFPLQSDQIVVDPLRQRALGGFFRASADLSNRIAAQSEKSLTVNTPLLAGLGNDFTMSPGPKGVALSGSPTLGVVFFELPQLSEATKARAKAFPLVIAGSSWNEEIMRAHGLTNVTTVIKASIRRCFTPARAKAFWPTASWCFQAASWNCARGRIWWLPRLPGLPNAIPKPSWSPPGTVPGHNLP